jgi:hypothetical protein
MHVLIHLILQFHNAYTFLIIMLYTTIMYKFIYQFKNNVFQSNAYLYWVW